MEPKYTVTLHIRREADGREAVLQFNASNVAEIPDKEGRDLGRFRLVPEGLPDAKDQVATRDFSECLKYCLIDDANSLPYCLAICGAAGP
ncbi:MAG: hypothetical protein ABI592_08305 [Acidobacteriota bacterium]